MPRMLTLTPPPPPPPPPLTLLHFRPGAPNIKLASAMAELLRSARMMQMMKRRDSGNGEEAADSGGDRPEHALISMLEVN